jgi:LmbE family N-acetylglucosaminyl deacetylase
MAVHAHPDDESSSTGGILARYAAEGIRTVLVTCTNGEFGDAPGGVKPGSDGHDKVAVAQIRLAELAEACRVLGVEHLELLGYQDSGMAEWQYKEEPEAFCNAPVPVAAARLTELFERYRPDVVVTYDDDGFYEHPDHVQASRVTMAAVEASAIPKKAYFTAMRRSDFGGLRDALRDHGVEMPEFAESPEWLERMAALESKITTTVDTVPFVAQKRKALGAHDSQIGESFFGKLPDEVFGAIFGTECFIRAYDTTGASLPENDLFAGLR